MWISINKRLVCTVYPNFFSVNMIFSAVQTLGYNKICMGFNRRGGARGPLSAPRLSHWLLYHWAVYATLARWSTLNSVGTRQHVLRFVADIFRLSVARVVYVLCVVTSGVVSRIMSSQQKELITTLLLTRHCDADPIGLAGMEQTRIFWLDPETGPQALRTLLF